MPLFFKSLIMLCLIGFNTSLKAQALPAPNWQCIQTQTNDVVLNWEIVNDPNGDFVSYEIHTLTNGLIHTETNINTTTFTHNGVNDVRDYFIKTISTNGESTSLTMQNIQLTLNNPNNGTAILNWNDPGNNISSPFSNKAYIYRTDGIGNLSLRDSVLRPTDQFRDTIDICSGTMEYQIRIPGNGCMFTSSIQSDFFEDKTTPYTPNIHSVSIDTTNQNINISWNANGARDTYGYIIYKRDPNGLLVEIDTVWGRFNTTYSYSDNTTDGPLSYSIAAFDSCLTESVPPTFQTSAKGEIKTSCFLTGKYDPCLGMVSLSWSTYSHFGNDPNITVFYLEQGIWKDEAAMSSNAHNITFGTAGLYSFVVRYKAADGREIFSNLIQIQTDAVTTANVHYLSTASVDKDKVELIHYIDPPSAVQAIAFSRKDNEGIFKEVGRVNVDDEWTTYVDNQAKTNKVNTYVTHLIDQCGNKVLASNEAQTIYLTVNSDQNNFTNALSWTPYIGFDGGVLEYELYRIIDGQIEANPFTVVNGSTFNFTDDISNIRVSETICYQVVAIENQNQYNFAQWAGSNYGCGDFEPSIYTPNAFTPNGANPLFKPEFAFNDFLSFEMNIFNRWGKLIYSSTDPHSGWDGTVQRTGENATPEVYSYWFKFIDIEEKEHIGKGHVTLIR